MESKDLNELAVPLPDEARQALLEDMNHFKPAVGDTSVLVSAERFCRWLAALSAPSSRAPECVSVVSGGSNGPRAYLMPWAQSKKLYQAQFGLADDETLVVQDYTLGEPVASSRAPLAELLKEFGQHKVGCDAHICSECGYGRSYGCQGLHSGGWRPLACTCGLSAALASLKELSPND